jgi:adenylate cyclase
MKRILIILLTISCSLFAIHCSAQLQGQALIDSMLKELPRQKEDTNKVNILDELSWSYIQTDPDEAIKHELKGLELATKLGWKKGMAKAYFSLAQFYSHKNYYPRFMEYSQEALKIYEAIGDQKGMSMAYTSIAVVYINLEDYANALEYQFKALKIGEAAGNKAGVAAMYYNIAYLYLSQHNYPKALEYDNKALKLNEELGNKGGVAMATGHIGKVYSSQRNYPKALEYYLNCLKMQEELQNKFGTVSATHEIAEVYTAQKNYATALVYGQKALQIAEESKSAYLIKNELQTIGCIYLSMYKDSTEDSKTRGEATILRKAIDYFERSLAKTRAYASPSDMMGCYEYLGEAYKLSGNYKKAIANTDSGRVIRDSIFSTENNIRIARMENARGHYVDSLNTAATQKVAEVKAQQRRNYEYIGAGAFVLLLGFAFFMARNNKLLAKEKRKSDTLLQKSDTLLLNILPGEVADELKATGATTAKHYDNVTVLFTDFVNFTQAAEQMNAQELIDELHACFKVFDEITSKYNIEKIKTIGDAYLAVGGLPSADPKHAENVVSAAREINTFMQDRLSKMGSDRTFQVRIGIHSGSVVAGIVGVKKFAYDIWGDTVNTAARMEQNSEAGRINISETTYDLVKDKFSCEYRGGVEAKGKGVMKMYFVG